MKLKAHEDVTNTTLGIMVTNCEVILIVHIQFDKAQENNEIKKFSMENGKIKSLPAGS